MIAAAAGHLRRAYLSTAVGEEIPDDRPPGLDDQGWLDLVEGAGFAPAGGGRLRRRRSLADTVADGMTLLVCGLNPSPAAADTGVGYAGPGNRFWPALRAAGLVSADRRADAALDGHGIGMTDLVKRTTRRADELTTPELRHGMGRVGRLVAALAPGAVCFVGLAGFRATVDARAVAGPQPEPLAGRPVYVMPSTSGRNAHARLDDLNAHLGRAAELAHEAA